MRWKSLWVLFGFCNFDQLDQIWPNWPILSKFSKPRYFSKLCSFTWLPKSCFTWGKPLFNVVLLGFYRYLMLEIIFKIRLESTLECFTSPFFPTDIWCLMRRAVMWVMRLTWRWPWSAWKLWKSSWPHPTSLQHRLKPTTGQTNSLSSSYQCLSVI